MSFGYSVGDGVLLVQLAWRTLQGARKACGEHDELTREVASLHRVLQRLQKELANPDSLLNRADDDRRRELDEHGNGCERVLNIMNSIVTKYNKLSDTERSAKRIWQKIKFGNGEMKDLAEIRLKLSAHTSAITMNLNLCSLGSQGRVEKQLSDVGGDLKGIRGKVDWIAANMTARSGDGTVWTSYENDDRSFWRQLRRELVKEGYRSSVLHRHKGLLKAYVEELGQRGIFDQVDSEDNEELEKEAENSVKSEDDDSDVVELEDSEPESSDHEPMLLNNNRKTSQVARHSGPRTPCGTENPSVGPSRTDYILLQSPDINGPQSSVPPTSQMEPFLEVLSPANGLPDEPDFPLSQPRSQGIPSREPVIASAMIAQPVHMEEVLDEDFLHGAHPNCFTEGASSDIPGEDIQYTVPANSVTSERPLSNATDPESFLASGGASGNNARDFILLSSLPSPSRPISAVDEMSEQLNDQNIRKQRSRKRYDPREEGTPDDRRITFKDPRGRTWIFPFSRVKTWAGITSLIKKAFPDAETLGISLRNAGYDLIGPEGTMILPEVWHELVEPDWSVSLQPRNEPWKLDERSPGRSNQSSPHTPSPPPPPPLLPRAATFQSSSYRGRGGLRPFVVDSSSEDSDSDSSHRYDGSTPRSSMKQGWDDPYIVEPHSPPPRRKKPTLQTHSSAPPIIPAHPRKSSSSKTQEYPRQGNGEKSNVKENRTKGKKTMTDKNTLRSSDSRLPILTEENSNEPTTMDWDSRKDLAAKYMQAARRKIGEEDVIEEDVIHPVIRGRAELSNLVEEEILKRVEMRRRERIRGREERKEREERREREEMARAREITEYAAKYIQAGRRKADEEEGHIHPGMRRVTTFHWENL